MGTEMKMKTSELAGPVLDWVVAKCEGIDVEVHSADMIIKRRLRSITQEEAARMAPPKPYLVVPGVGNANYSGDWAQGGPIIEREMKKGLHLNGGTICVATYYHESLGGFSGESYGPTPLVAAMRCYVASKMGDAVEVPDELTQNI